MASTAEIRLTINWADGGEGLRLMQRMAQEITALYDALDQVGSMIGTAEYPRNLELAHDIAAFIEKAVAEADGWPGTGAS